MSQRVLYIESDSPTRERVRSLLEALGFAVEESATALDGIARAHASAPDLVLVGTRMPDLRNAELAARLRKDVSLAPVPLVAVGSSLAEREVALAAGWDGFIPRAVDDSTFVAQVRAYQAGKRERLSPRSGVRGSFSPSANAAGRPSFKTWPTSCRRRSRPWPGTSRSWPRTGWVPPRGRSARSSMA